MSMRLVSLLVMVAMSLSGCAFVPDATEDRDDSFDPSGFEQVAQGTWEGADSVHKASGTVTLYQGDDGAVILFENFEGTAGPDVYLYGSPHENPDHLDGATKILVPGGEADGRATLRGTFTVPLPNGLQPGDVNSLVLWCDQFAVHFGTASLS